MIGDRADQQIHECAKLLGCAVSHGFGLRITLAGAAFDHIGGERPGSAGEADQRGLGWQRSTDQPQRGIGWCQQVSSLASLEAISHRRQFRQATRHRTFACTEMQVLSQRPGNGQNVGEQDRTIKAVAADRLQGHFCRRCRIVAEVQKAALVGTQLPVLRQVPTSLPHQPRGTRPLWLTAQGGKEWFISGGLERHGHELRG